MCLDILIYQRPSTKADTHLVNDFPAFMEPKNLTLWSSGPTIGSRPDWVKFNLHFFTVCFFRTYFNIIHPSMPTSPKWSFYKDHKQIQLRKERIWKVRVFAPFGVHQSTLFSGSCHSALKLAALMKGPQKIPEFILLISSKLNLLDLSHFPT